MPTPTPTPTGYADFAAVYRAVASGVAEVEATTCDGESFGTGFLVGSDRLVTAAHVINGASKLEIKTDDGTVGASIEGVDRSVDLAMLKLSRPVSGHVFALAAAPPSPGTRVVTIGYPLAGPKGLSSGVVSGLGRKIRTESGTLVDMVQTDTPINLGNSGGPFVDVTGDVIGVADAVRTDANGIGYAVPASAVAARLSGAERWTPVEPSDCNTRGGDTDLPVSSVIQYLLAVNTGDYDAARAVVTSSFAKRNLGSESAWSRAYATTYDDDFVLVDAAANGSKADVQLQFRSQQAPGYGPKGAVDATCLRWELVYHVVDTGSDWKIDSANTMNTPGWTRC